MHLPAPTLGAPEADRLRNYFVKPPDTSRVRMPRQVLAVDGSPHEASIDDLLPSTKVGYLKIGCVLIKMAAYNALEVEGGRFVIRSGWRGCCAPASHWPSHCLAPTSTGRAWAPYATASAPRLTNSCMISGRAS